MADQLKQIKEFPNKADFGDEDLLLIQGFGTTYNVKGTALKGYARAATEAYAQAAKESAKEAEASAVRSETAVEHPPVLDIATGFWQFWDRTSGTYVPTEYRGLGRDFTILGYYPTLEALEAAVPSPEAGDIYGVGTEPPYEVYVWDAVAGMWRNNGTLLNSGDMTQSVYDPQKKRTDIFAYADGVGLPAGGSTGQIPVKLSDEDYDVQWQDAPETGVISFKGRAGKVTPLSGDYSVSQVTGAAPTQNPVFTGSISLGRKTDTVSATNSFAVGSNVEASGSAAHAEGSNTIASGWYTHAEGNGTTASGDAAHAEGYKTTASKFYAHAEGGRTVASDYYAHAEGDSTIASGSAAHAGGSGTIAAGVSQTAIGRYNVEESSTITLFIIGKGTSNARANCFRVTSAGVYASGNYNTSGADYAELFEWADNNPEGADRVGRFVTLEGAKIRFAMPDDDYILGIVSGAPSVVGDVYDDQWAGMFLIDIFGRPLWEDVEVPEVAEEIPDPEDPEKTITHVIIPAHTERRQKLNPNYDNTQKYIPRTERPEWSAVGLLGKLMALEDGSCEVDHWCKPGEGGVAMASQERTRFRVMEKMTDPDTGRKCVRVMVLPS